MANEDKKDFNAMLHDSKDMPKFQIIIDQKSIEKYGGNKMYFAPPIDYDKVMKKVPYGKVITVGKIREHFAKLSGADFTEPITAGIFVSIVAWASYQRSEDETPYWRTLKANGELNAKYPNGIEAQKEKLEAEGHTIIQKGRKNIRYYVKDYENSLFDLKSRFPFFHQIRDSGLYFIICHFLKLSLFNFNVAVISQGDIIRCFVSKIIHFIFGCCALKLYGSSIGSNGWGTR